MGDGALQRFLDAARIDVAGQVRRRARREADLALGEATVVGLLRELAERRAPARLELTSGPPVAGRVDAVGRDVVVVAASSGATLVALRAVVLVDSAPAASGAAAVGAGDRAPSHDVGLLEVLADLCGAGTDVTTWLDGRAEPVRGRLVGVGVDVLVMRRNAAARSAVSVPASAVVAVRLA